MHLLHTLFRGAIVTNGAQFIVKQRAPDWTPVRQLRISEVLFCCMHSSPPLVRFHSHAAVINCYRRSCRENTSSSPSHPSSDMLRLLFNAMLRSHAALKSVRLERFSFSDSTPCRPAMVRCCDTYFDLLPHIFGEQYAKATRYRDAAQLRLGLSFTRQSVNQNATTRNVLPNVVEMQLLLTLDPRGARGVEPGS